MVVLLADGFEFAKEVLVGQVTGVLEFAETLVGNEIEVAFRNNFFEGTAAFISFAVLLVSEPAEEVLRGIVEQVLNEMMADTEVWFAFSIDESWSVAIENLTHERMTGSASMMAHTRCIIPSFRLLFAIRRRINVD